MKGLKRVFAILIALVIVLSTFAVSAFAADPITSYATVTASTLNIRSDSSTSSNVLGQIPGGQTVGVHWSIPGWSLITYNGVTGYVSVEYLKATKTAPSGSAGQAVVKLESATLNLRAAASTDSAILGQIPNGQQLTIAELSNGWAKVTYNGTTGYVSSKFLVIGTQSQSTTQTGSAPETLPSRGTSVSTKGQAIVELAKQHLGKPYVYGATGPNNFDCSGFVYYVYKQMGVTLNRVAHDQMNNGTYVSKDQLQPGDIVGFSRGNGYVHHVGIYVGNGMMIHSPQTGDVVKYESIIDGGYGDRYYSARRIF